MSYINSINIIVYNDCGGRTYTLENTKIAGTQLSSIYLLDKIDEILKNNLPYTPYPNDSKRQIAPDQAPTLLQEIAKYAYANFLTHQAANRNKDWPQVRRLLKIYSPSLPFIEEIIKIVTQNLRFNDLISYSKVNLKAHRESQTVFRELAISNGYHLCTQSFSLSISHIDYLKTLSYFKEKVYDTHKQSYDEMRLFQIKCEKLYTFKYSFKMDTAITFQSELDLCGNDGLIEKIKDEKFCTLYERAIFCSLAHIRATALTPRQALLLKHSEKNIKKNLLPKT